jgi:hypothetical protein
MCVLLFWNCIYCCDKTKYELSTAGNELVIVFCHYVYPQLTHSTSVLSSGGMRYFLNLRTFPHTGNGWAQLICLLKMKKLIPDFQVRHLRCLQLTVIYKYIKIQYIHTYIQIPVKHNNSSEEITNKMQPCNIIYYSTVHWRLNMFRAAHRSSSAALTVTTIVAFAWRYAYDNTT